MLDEQELEDIALRFGVQQNQVRRDHLISHLLKGMADLDVSVTFFGGTALARTHLTDPDDGARLSEDIDLYGTQRKSVAARLDSELPRLLRRDYPGGRWDPALGAVRSVEPAQFVTRDGLRVRIQLLASDGDGNEGLARWPTEKRQIDLRYSDVTGSARIAVPTLAAFVAMKTLAWVDRRAARDLYDLAGLAKLRAFDVTAAELFRMASGWRLAPFAFDAVQLLDWRTQLAHQTKHLPSAAHCLGVVRRAWAEALDWEDA